MILLMERSPIEYLKNTASSVFSDTVWLISLSRHIMAEKRLVILLNEASSPLFGSFFMVAPINDEADSHLTRSYSLRLSIKLALINFIACSLSNLTLASN